MTLVRTAILTGLYVLCACLTPSKAWSQPVVPASGRVIDHAGDPIPGVSVLIIDTGRGTSTNSEGHFDLGRQNGLRRLRFSAVGYRPVEGVWRIDPESKQVFIVQLDEDVIDMNAVVVDARSENANLRQNPFAVSGVDLRTVRSTSATLDDVLRSSPGVMVRKEGGLGSRSEFALNGLNGRQVRFFLDGLPLDPIGGSQILADLPPILVDRAEIYKGAVPISLGGDALGGAVHLLSRPTDRAFTDAMVSAGSFRTGKAAMVSQWVSHSAFFRISAFGNRSDNNYKIRVRIPDPRTGTYGPEQSVERFHDGYASGSVQLEAGIKHHRLADSFRVLANVQTLDDEVQHAISLDRVFGRVTTWSRMWSIGAVWEKELGPASLTIRMRQYRNRSGVVDTSAVSYDWTGSWVSKNNPSIAESSWQKSLFRYDDIATVGNAIVRYEPFKTHRFEGAYTLNRLVREGDDPLSRYPVAFAAPNTLTKHTFAVSHSWTSASESRTVTSYLKAHLSDAHSVSVDFDGIRTSHKSSEFMPGIGLAVRHQLASPLWIKGSYERTLRLPDAYEQFGDGLLLLPNPQLKPERSHNANLGIVAEFSHTDHEWWFETQTFVRQVTDLIRVEAVGLTAQYVNQRNVRSAGIDAALRYTWRRMWSFETSATFQDLRNMSRFEDGRPSYVYLDRIPNSPFFISSQQIRFSTSWMEAAWTGYYVEAYYLKWPSLGAADGKHVIPTQFTQSLRVQLGRSDRPHSLTLECLNLTSARVYDQFRLQKPGRSFHLTYRLHYK